jgi:hypothetical protein
MDKNELRKQWKDRIESYRSSGLTMSAWCSANGFTLDQLKYWLYKGKKKETPATAPQSTPAFVSVAVTSAAEQRSSVLWIEVGSARIEVQHGFQPELLREVVAALS